MTIEFSFTESLPQLSDLHLHDLLRRRVHCLHLTGLISKGIQDSHSLGGAIHEKTWEIMEDTRYHDS